MGDIRALSSKVRKLDVDLQLMEVEKFLRSSLDAITRLPPNMASAYQVTAAAIQLQLLCWKSDKV